MPFWSSDKLEAVQKEAPLVTPFDRKRIEQGAYELSMGPQGAISADGRNRITDLKPKQEFCIPEGQFGLLVTEERVTIPHNVLAFISLKTSFKSQGLVNVSGFHVDPGYDARLKFWVYNAGNQPVTVLRGDAAFLIWFAEMDRPTRDPYKKSAAGHSEITAADLRNLQGNLASPAELAKRIKELRNEVKLLKWTVKTVVVILIGLCLALVTPLLDWIIKPMLERFGRDYSHRSEVVAPAIPGTVPTTAPLSPPQPLAPSPPQPTPIPAATKPATISGHP